MKKIGIFVLGVLVGLAGYALAKEKVVAKSASTEGSAELSFTALPETAATEMGVTKKDAFVSVVSFDGKIRYFIPSGSRAEELPMPMTKPVTVENILPMNMFVYSASPTCLGQITVNGRPVSFCPK